ncbi:penicillin-binding protein 2 [Hoyosella rhizosphaerae]|uniref:Penicillin-binding protein A n=1 Tax=Hoyosella rhizosphaerae TaxID=1755582 RepID=A0A916U8B7_9ACTN|nr:penicillin-binding protein 2 [Hoyosella rhizosphaerae]MBN4927454.1 penicillin-binding protein 2 [Hoyosella rhizosphaerae]GGC64278.1 penicillin-binding protein A [Hoyosella rhizosphaerae]
MNTPLKRAALAVMVMVALLIGNAAYVQVFKADELRANPFNSRVLLDEFARHRGQISAAGQVLASSIPIDSRFRYQRTYPAQPGNPNSPEAFAPITGFYSMQFRTSGLENAEDSILNGSDDQLFGRRLLDLITGRDPRGGNVVTTLQPFVQQVAYDELASRGYAGSVVAIEPSTGEILAMASAPSYDPNPLANHDSSISQGAWDELQADPRNPMLNRAAQSTYPPGSTFKVVSTAAALASGVTPNDQFTAAAQYTLPGTNTTLQNYGGATCGGGASTTLFNAFRLSCNTAFVEMGIATGTSALKDTASAFGIDSGEWDIPLRVAPSTVGEIDDSAALGQSSIGQRDVALTPLQNAVIAATVANGGMRLEPQLVHQLQGPNLSVLSSAQPTEVQRAISPAIAETLTQMMIASELNTTGAGAVPGVQIASKTGTAEHGTDPRNTPPHAWYIAFAPAENPRVAVAVIVEDGGDRSLAATGGSVAAPIGRAVIRAALQGG